MSGLFSALRKAMRPLRSTVLHPQWLAFREDAVQRRWVKQVASGRVLDIGSADGHMRNLLERCEYVALDYPVTAQGLYGTRPDIFADAAALPFADACMDTVLLLEVLEHVRDARGVLGEISRVLKPGGVLLLSIPFLYPLHDAPHDYRRYTAPGLEDAIRRAGLDGEPATPRTRGFQAAALLVAIACAEGVLQAWRHHRWRLLFAPPL
ncbi:MAG: class I SAM-dependent methyltransferase, partial [Rhodanobacter sp.]